MKLGKTYLQFLFIAFIVNFMRNFLDIFKK